MHHDHHDDVTTGRVLARREVLALFGTTAGAAVLASYVPNSSGAVARRSALGVATAAAAEPTCIVRPEQTEGPYFVDERLNRSDIRSDPSDGSIKQGVELALGFAVSRIDGSSCVPFEGALVDVWHCDAAGVYSDTEDPGFDTTGQKFLRGYQVTDANGGASFVTIYPGWYQGRTVHIHFKIRTDPEADTGLEFTSQLYFDDELTDVVHARQPYAAKGQRTLRNDGDGIYQNGGDQLLLRLSEDGAGGYVATFDIGIEVSGTTTSTTTPAGGTTTTSLAGGSCATIAACLADLQRALPGPATASSRRAKRTAHGLRRRTARVGGILERAAASGAGRQATRYARARGKLQKLLAASQTADIRGTLGVPFAPIEATIGALLGQIPS